MAFFVKNLTYTRTIKDPESGEEATVTLRPLNAGDRAELQDLTRMSGGDDGGAELRLGAMQLVTLKRAIVDWTLPEPTTAEAIAGLHPDVFDAIYEYVSWGAVPPEPEQPEKAENPTSAPSEPAETGGELLAVANS